MELDQIFKYLDYLKTLIELGILVGPFVYSFFHKDNKQ
nr:MAG TPA: hypothetical protein [Caudoviricetes sp.]